jgi:DUF971 family protein
MPVQAWPAEIVDHRASHVLELVWQDGVRSRLPYQSLRAACRCAECTNLRRRGEAVRADEAVEINEMVPIGQSGLQFRFSDGHERGIFPWAYLRDLSQQ